MMNISLYQFYTDKVAALTAEIVKLKRHNTTFVLAELAAFVESVEGRAGKVLTSLQSVKDTYQLISTLKNK